MANKKQTYLTHRYSIKGNPADMLAFDLRCKQAGTNRSARIAELVRSDIAPVAPDEMAFVTYRGIDQKGGESEPN